MKNYWNRLTAVVHEIKTELFSSFISVLYHLLPLLCVFWNSIEKCCLYTQQQSRSAQFDANTINAAALDIITTPGTSGDISILFSLHSSTLLCIYRHFFFLFLFFFLSTFHRSSSSSFCSFSTPNVDSLANFSISCINSRGFSSFFYTRRR